jgi:NitT/TauT family transport system substrate-binding protein
MKPVPLEKVSVTILFLFFFFCPGCGQKKQEIKLNKINIAFQQWVGYGPLYLAQEKGFFRKEGIELIFIDEQLDSARRDAFKVGMLDCEAGTIDLLVAKRAQDTPIAAVLEMDYSFGGDGIVATSDIQKLEGLYGKTVALARDDVGESFISFLFHKYGLSLDKLTFVAKRPQEVAQAFLIGEVDAVVTWEPWLSQALERSASHILVSSKEESGVIIDTLNIREDIIKNNPALVKGLMRGWFKAVEYCQEHPQEASEIIAGHYNLTAEEYRKQLEGLRWLDYRGQLSQERYNSWVDVFNTVAEIKFLNGRISKKPDAQSALNQELLKGLYPAFAEDPPPTAGLDECEGTPR